MNDTDGLYARAHKVIIEQWLPLQKGKTFTTEDVIRYFKADGVRNYRDGSSPLEFRRALATVLWNITHRNKTPDLEQNGNRYRLINRDFKVVTPGSTKGGNDFPIVWPRGVSDNTEFGFASTVVVKKGDVLGLGGEGNRGKSAFALNLTTENMDTHPVTLVLSENVHRLEDRLSHFDWVELLKPDGNWKFEVLEAHGSEEFLDIVRERANNLVIIDWLSVTKEAYLVADFYRSVSTLLNDGVCLVVQQKRSYKEYVVGGEGALDNCSVFLILTSGILEVAKAKEWQYNNPNNAMYRFAITNDGSRFCSIGEVKKCPECHGNKFVKGVKCGRCYGNGFIDVLEEI